MILHREDANLNRLRENGYQKCQLVSLELRKFLVWIFSILGSSDPIFEIADLKFSIPDR